MRVKLILRLTVVVLTCLLLWAAVLWLLPASQTVRANPGTRFVSVSGTGATCSQAQPCGLQTALAQSMAGDVVYVAAGTYTGTGKAVVNITKGITLYGGWNGAASGPVVRDPVAYRSILDGQAERRVMYINGAFACTVDGFTIQRGNATEGAYGEGYGGGICSYLAWPLIANNVISGNTGIAPQAGSHLGYGGGVWIGYAMHGAVIRGNRIEGNVVTRSGQGTGGGLCLWDSAGGQILDNVVLNNTAAITNGGGWGGGVAIVLSNGCTVTGNTIESNQGNAASLANEGRGGGVYLDGSSDVVLSNNRIRNNVAGVAGPGYGGGVGAYGAKNLLAANNLVEGNTAAATPAQADVGFGGGMFVHGSQNVNLTGNRIHNNTANETGGYGGGLQIQVNTSFTMTNNIVAGNRSSGYGGGLYLQAYETRPVTGTLLHNTFVANNGGSGYGRVGIELISDWIDLALVNNLFSTHSYALYCYSGGRATLTRNLFYANSIADIGGAGTVVNTGAITGQDPLLDADYHLLTGSPAIDAGLDAGVTTDIDGDARPMGGGYDIGADEHRGQPERWFVYLPVVLKAR